MQLKINSSYKTPTGYIVPRSHLKHEKGMRYCIVQVYTGDLFHYTSKYATMTCQEIRKAMGLPQKERIEIL